MQPALQDEPRPSRGVLGPSLAKNQPKTDPEISGQIAFRYPGCFGLCWVLGALKAHGRPQGTSRGASRAPGARAEMPRNVGLLLWYLKPGSLVMSRAQRWPKTDPKPKLKSMF